MGILSGAHLLCPWAFHTVEISVTFNPIYFWESWRSKPGREYEVSIWEDSIEPRLGLSTCVLEKNSLSTSQWWQGLLLVQPAEAILVDVFGWFYVLRVGIFNKYEGSVRRCRDFLADSTVDFEKCDGCNWESRTSRRKRSPDQRVGCRGSQERLNSCSECNRWRSSAIFAETNGGGVGKRTTSLVGVSWEVASEYWIQEKKPVHRLI